MRATTAGMICSNVYFAETTDKSHFARTPPPSFNVAFTAFLSLPIAKTNRLIQH